MNLIKRLYLMCKIRFGTLELEELEQLCAIYVEYQNPKETASWISLPAWKKLSRKDCNCFFKLYLQHHTADEGLFKDACMLENESIRNAYLQSLSTRKIPPTRAEEKWILNCGKPGVMQGIKLSAQGEYELMQSDNYDMIENYLSYHVLREAGGAQLALNAADKEHPNRAAEYRRLLGRYFEWQGKIQGKRLFTEFMAQWCLFADERNREFIFCVLEQCDMDNPLESATIRRMALEMSPEYLTWYLAYSYIPSTDLVSELLEKGLIEHHKDMITISEQRRVIHEMVTNSLQILNDDWRDEELLVYERFDREESAKKRMSDLQEFLRPRAKNGAISPAMSAWVAARCPELAKEMQVNLNRYEQRIMNKIAFTNPLDFNYYTGANLH